MADLGTADLSNPDKCGYLHKRSQWMKEWRKRYFVLKGSTLYFCKDNGKKAHGSINLKDCLRVLLRALSPPRFPRGGRRKPPCRPLSARLRVRWPLASSARPTRLRSVLKGA